jgi:PadR family transcriptional regulator, regulatory protein PadR
MATPQLTPQTLKVLAVLHEAPGSTGAQVCRATGLPSGTVYPILARFEQAGWLRSRWEGGDPAQLGRPRQRFYTLTAVAAAQARTRAAELTRFIAGFAT